MRDDLCFCLSASPPCRPGFDRCTDTSRAPEMTYAIPDGIFGKVLDGFPVPAVLCARSGATASGGAGLNKQM
ncbi:hypothetical protein GCM10027261_19310 [Geodermatophilus arenarius]